MSSKKKAPGNAKDSNNASADAEMANTIKNEDDDDDATLAALNRGKGSADMEG